MKLGFSLATLLLACCSMAASADDVPVRDVDALPPKRQCRVVITLEMKNGKVEENAFFTNAKTEKDCRKEAALYRTNFAPQVVKRKTVKVEWTRS
jgi:hypothetical protein